MKSGKFYVHGFLGCSDEFKNLGFLGLDLYKLSFLNDDSIKEYLSGLDLKNSTCIGYSMGGRFILKYFSFFKKCSHVYLLGSHPGILDESERKESELFFKKNLDFLLKNDEISFLKYWNNLNLFDGSRPILKYSRNLEKIISLYKKWPTYLQKDYTDLINENENVKLCYGSKDIKYLKMYQSRFLPKKLIEIKGFGHRLNTGTVIEGLIND